MKVRIEIDPDGEEEVVIRCKEITPKILRLQETMGSERPPGAEAMELTLGDRSFIVPVRDILFFETADGKTTVHTADRMYYTEEKLYGIEEMLPRHFTRVSKSCILNVSAVTSLRRELTGICEATLRGCAKKVFISRMYYKPFREMLTERIYHDKSK